MQTLHRRACRVLPERLETCGVIATGESDELLALMFPLRHRRRGALAFRLSASTVAALAESPLFYLKDAVRAREGLGRLRVPFVYRAWRCLREPMYWRSLHAADRAASVEGVRMYFTPKTDGKAVLWLFPAAWMVIYAWDDSGMAIPEAALR